MNYTIRIEAGWESTEPPMSIDLAYDKTPTIVFDTFEELIHCFKLLNDNAPIESKFPKFISALVFEVKAIENTRSKWLAKEKTLYEEIKNAQDLVVKRSYRPQKKPEDA